MPALVDQIGTINVIGRYAADARRRYRTVIANWVMTWGSGIQAWSGGAASGARCTGSSRNQ
jgi:hypothetical protein